MSTVYVSLLNEGVPVWRPVLATRLAEGAFRLAPTAAVPPDEEWQFRSGAFVTCEDRWLSAGVATTVAVALDYRRTARYAILALGAEDLWHLGNADTYLPTIPPELRHTTAHQALLELIAEGLVELRFGRMATNSVTTVPLERVATILQDPDAWDPTKDVGHQGYCFINTEAGDEAYRSGRV